MRFTKTSLPGAWLIEPECHRDKRGFFARSYCEREFEERGLWHNWVQFNISYNESKGTLRGLHFSLSTVKEVKIVRCTSGSIFDVIVDQILIDLWRLFESKIDHVWITFWKQ